MPQPTYVDPVATKLEAATREITSAFYSGLGLEPEVSFGTKQTTKRYGIIYVASSPIETGGREGVIGGYQRYKILMNYSYGIIVSSQPPPDSADSTVAYLNGKIVFHIQTFRGFVDNLNAVINAGNNVAEVRVESLDSICSQQAREPRAYELMVVGQLGLYYHVKKGFYGEPVGAIEPTNP